MPEQAISEAMISQSSGGAINRDSRIHVCAEDRHGEEEYWNLKLYIGMGTVGRERRSKVS